MQVKDKIFPYPIINHEKRYSNLLASDFDIVFDQNQAEDEASYTLRNCYFKTESAYINSLFDEGKIGIVLVIECSYTVYRKAIELTKEPQDISLLKVDFTEKVDVSMFAYAKKDFIMKSDEFDDDYKGMTFEIEKYDIIGVNDGFNIYFRHDYSKDNLSRSIFSIVPNENMESGAYSVDYNTGNKIVISLSKEDYQNFELINRAQIYKEIAFNMILIPALIEGLSLCKKGMDYASKDLDDIENDYVWFRSIRKAFSRLKGREITSQDLDKPIDMAQELLGKPFSVALEKIMEEMNKNMGDEENE